MEEKVTVLMTTYNEEKKIFEEALVSILNQTFKDISVLIIVDNKENEDIIKTIEEYTKKDNRIRYLINEKNLGLAQSLNKGIETIKTEYIARMDADDIALKDRIEKQFQYAMDNVEIDLFGSNIYYIDYDGNELYKRNSHTTDCDKIKYIMKYINIFHHPTLFGKTEIFKHYMYRNIKYAQDYDFICRLIESNCKIGNMNDYLLKYRLPKKIDIEKKYHQKVSFYCIQSKYKNGNLNQTDINAYIERELYKNNPKRHYNRNYSI